MMDTPQTVTLQIGEGQDQQNFRFNIASLQALADKTAPIYEPLFGPGVDGFLTYMRALANFMRCDSFYGAPDGDHQQSTHPAYPAFEVHMHSVRVALLADLCTVAACDAGVNVRPQHHHERDDAAFEMLTNWPDYRVTAITESGLERLQETRQMLDQFVKRGLPIFSLAKMREDVNPAESPVKAGRIALATQLVESPQHVLKFVDDILTHMAERPLMTPEPSRAESVQRKQPARREGR